MLRNKNTTKETVDDQDALEIPPDIFARTCSMRPSLIGKKTSDDIKARHHHSCCKSGKLEKLLARHKLQVSKQHNMSDENEQGARQLKYRYARVVFTHVSSSLEFQSARAT